MDHVPPHLQAPADLAAEQRRCCVGIDYPGIGYVHAVGCGSNRAAHCSDAALAANRREGLLAQLIFAANNLAEANILPGSAPICRECYRGVSVARASHAESCLTGRVLDLIEVLVANDSIPTERKETAGGEEGRAGEGVLPRGPLNSPACCNGLETEDGYLHAFECQPLYEICEGDVLRRLAEIGGAR